MSDDRLDAALRYFWHPVCQLQDLTAARPHPLAVQLLGQNLAIAAAGPADAPRVVAVTDRCPHRSTRLSVGWVEDDGIRCAYHGWCFGPDGRCRDIPSLPDGPIPPRALVDTFDAAMAYGLVWVRLDASVPTSIPANPAWDDPTMRVLPGRPYTWPTAAPRRVENFVDLAHFAWVHDGTLGRRDEPVPPVPVVRREDGELRFEYDPPDLDADPEALYGHSRYRMPIPLTVNIEFVLETGARRHLWMTASPVDSGSCRSFWFVSRDDDLDGDDAPHLAFQGVVLAEDEPVVTNQDPPQFPIDPGAELSVRTDRVSIEYRRWLRDLVDAAGSPEPAAAVRSVLAAGCPVSAPTV